MPGASALGGAAQPQATPERPWLGLAHFTEEDHAYFYGRDAEVRELAHRIQRAPLTVLYGVSGYGKSSVIGAGLIPALRAAGYSVVLRRRCYDDLAAWPLESDVIAACLARIPGCKPPDPAAPVTLWEFFHNRAQPWFQPASGEDAESQDPVSRPVLLFDQFEEIFIKGEDRASRDPAADARAREAARGFLNQLADLVENRAPAALRERLRSGSPEERRVLARRFDFQARPVHIAIAVRDDFLARLERLRREMPSIMEHRVELRLLSGPQAFKAVFEPGTKRPGQPPILPPDVAAAIVRAAAGAAADVPLEEIDAVPPILSLLCERLNDRRLAASPPPSSITAADFSPGEAERILARFYDDKLRSHPQALREYLEDELVSDSGFRENVSLDSALASLHTRVPDVEARLRQLVDDRVLAIEDRGGVPRLELTHDTLAKLALERRADRRAHARRARAAAWVAASLTIAGISLGLTAWALVETRLARERAAEAETEKAGALALVRFMDAQVGEAFVDSVPVQLRERVSARVDAFYREHSTLATLDDHEQMGYHMRYAAVHLAAVDRYEKENIAQAAKDAYISWERDAASAELKEALRIGESLAAKTPDDHGVTRDLILTHIDLATLAGQLKDAGAAGQHLDAARALLGALVAAGPFSTVQYIAWMGLPNLDVKAAPSAPPAPGRAAFDPAEPTTNGLGMLFVPVPGTKAQFAAYQTRVKDFRVFIRDTGYVHMRETADPASRMWSLDRDGSKQRGNSWEDPGFKQTEDDPVVGVSWQDASAFCDWLTLRERAAGRLPADWEYRLPTDAEWSIAAGLTAEDPAKSPQEKDRKITDQYPWGAQWPPPAGAGNFAGAEADDAHWPATFSTIPGYTDGFARTAPAGSFKPARNGLYDLGGNVCEWCQDEYQPGDGYRVLRGASWSNFGQVALLLSRRYCDQPGYRSDSVGFRCVAAPAPR